MDAQELKSLSDAFHWQMVASVKKRCAIVAAPGSDVLRIRFAIPDLMKNSPSGGAAEDAFQFWAEGLTMVLE